MTDTSLVEKPLIKPAQRMTIVNAQEGFTYLCRVTSWQLPVDKGARSAAAVLTNATWSALRSRPPKNIKSKTRRF